MLVLKILEIIMIASHDSFTYLNPKNPLYKLFEFVWRTQDKSILAQEYYGVRYLDIRVKYSNGYWHICHGLVTFDKKYKFIKDILEDYHYYMRIVLESGNPLVEAIFKLECASIDSPLLDSYIIKKGWRIYKESSFNIVDLTWSPWSSTLSLWKNIKRFFSTSIKKHAIANNPNISNDMINDSSKLYFIDYVG